MTGDLNWLFVAVGALSLLAGLGTMAVAFRHGRQEPKGVALLIAGMMATAFGLLMAGFAIAFATAESMEVSR